MDDTAVKKRRMPVRTLNYLALLTLGPFVAYVAAGIAHGFAPLGSGFYMLTLSYAHWLGYSLIPLIFAALVMIKSRVIAWVVMILGGAYLGYVVQPQHEGARAAAPISSPQNVAEERLPIVNSTVELLPPDKLDATVTPETIRLIEGHYIQQIKDNVSTRSGGDQAAVSAVKVTASTMRVEESGHIVYITELDTSIDASADKIPYSLRVIWNIDDGALKRVQCVTKNPNDPWRRGKCGEKIAETFRWSGWHKD
ncbi:hypothetical protein [Stenotrophomonas maltophilia]|uniref:hypothetical protein n=1 Tax=Stenotrophomonas maltophilia TaxID=40324 RepID=UPI0012FD8086|nr:hypothetical protein [Stenotrophomonas maltophilia]